MGRIDAESVEDSDDHPQRRPIEWGHIPNILAGVVDALIL